MRREGRQRTWDAALRLEERRQSPTVEVEGHGRSSDSDGGGAGNVSTSTSHWKGQAQTDALAETSRLYIVLRRRP